MLQYLKWVIKTIQRYTVDIEVPIMEQATPLQKFLISATISGNIRKVS